MNQFDPKDPQSAADFLDYINRNCALDPEAGSQMIEQFMPHIQTAFNTLQAAHADGTAKDHQKIHYANMLILGWTGTTDPELGIEILSTLAEENNTEAQKMLGVSYAMGFGVTQDVHKAIKLFKEASNSYDEGAMFLTACAYMQGEYLEQNPEKARELLTTLTGLIQAALLRAKQKMATQSGVIELNLEELEAIDLSIKIDSLWKDLGPTPDSNLAHTL